MKKYSENATKELIKKSDFQLDPFQKNALKSIDAGHSVLVSAPTGSGKTVIAEYAVDHCLKLGKRIVYTAPIKALSNQKFRDFRKRYGDQVGIVTGDVSINPEASILIMTTEIFRNCIFEDQKRLENIFYVIFDEIHFINDETRGTVWEESIIFTPPHIQIVCLSATVPNLMELGEWIVSVRQCNLDVIEEQKRAVPLAHFVYSKHGMFPVADLSDPYFSVPKRNPKKFFILDHLLEQNHLPALIFSFNRKACERKAYHMKDSNVVTEEEKEKLTALIESYLKKFEIDNSSNENPLIELLHKGIGYHHAGMLPLLKELVERLFSTGLIKILFTTETFAMGINMPAYSVVFTELKRWNGTNIAFVKAGSYHQMAGRAGRRGMDDKGYVYAPLDSDPRTFRKTYDIITGDIEHINSQFNLSYSTLMNLHMRLREGIFEACDKSLGIYLKTKNQSEAYRKEIIEEQHKEVRKKLKILKAFHFINDEGSLSKGIFAVKLNGYEIHLTEFFFGGIFENLSVIELAVLLNSIVFEGKRSDWYQESPYESSPVVQKAINIIEPFYTLEKLYQVKDPIKLLDFRLASTIEAWVGGCLFEDLSKFTSCSPGDFVRTIRMTIQLTKQLIAVSEDHKSLQEKLRHCAKNLNRDQVDAERQLTLE